VEAIAKMEEVLRQEWGNPSSLHQWGQRSAIVLEEAIAQAQKATQEALRDGHRKLQVELRFPELKTMPVARQFLPIFEPYKDKVKVFFADPGGAALARRDWTDLNLAILDVGSGRTSGTSGKIDTKDEIFFFVAPSAVEVKQLEILCQEIGDRPIIMLNPKLEDASIVGIGYAGRQIRDRFLGTINTCYYLRPLDDQTALFYSYPDTWQLWSEQNGEYQKVADFPKKPSTEEIDIILMREPSKPQISPTSNQPPVVRKTGVFQSLGRFLKALSS
jgi:hypothetical protein